MNTSNTLNDPLSQGLYSTKEAARYLNLSYRTLEDWRLNGFGPPFIRIGRRAMYRKCDLDLFIASRTFRHTGEAKSYFVAPY